MRAVITGGAGFLGSHLVDRLLHEGVDCVIVDTFITGQLTNVQHLVGDPRVEFVGADVSHPFQVSGEVDYVFHFASPASPVDFARIPLEVMRCGSYGTHNSIALAMEKGARFLIASTSEVYGDPQVHPQPETYWGNVNPTGPRACYDESKRYAEAATCVYRDRYGLNSRIARFFNTYGPRMRLDDGRVVPNFVRQALRGEPITIYGDGRQTRSFGYYEDILDGVIRLIRSDYRDPVNLGTHEERTILEFAHAVIAATGSASEIVFMPAAVDDPRQRHPDITRANEILDWHPTTSLETGLQKTIDYFRDHLETLALKAR